MPSADCERAMCTREDYDLSLAIKVTTAAGSAVDGEEDRDEGKERNLQTGSDRGFYPRPLSTGELLRKPSLSFDVRQCICNLIIVRLVILSTFRLFLSVASSA